jgi:hypothetical protein
MTKKIQTDEKKSDLPIAIVNHFFPAPSSVKRPDQLPLIQVSQTLQKQGMPPSHLRQALVVLIGILSSKLGDPIPIAITEDEGAGAVEFLDSCLNMVPEDLWIDMGSLTAKGARSDLIRADKTAICYEGDQFKSELSKILSVVERGNLAKVGRDGKSGNAYLPGSFIALVKDPNNPILKNRYVTRIHVSADLETKKRRIQGMAVKSVTGKNVNFEIETACVKALFRRVKDVPVDVEFAEKIMDDSAVGIQNAVPLFDLSMRFIRNIARINNVMPVRLYEFETAFIGLNYDEVFPPKSVDGGDRLVATKIDYYYFLNVAGDFLRSGNDFLNPRQLAIYNAILANNMRKYEQERKKYPTPLDWLNYYIDSTTGGVWVTRAELFKYLQSQPGERFSDSTLFNELNMLLGRSLITLRRRTGSRKVNEFAVSQFLDYASLFNTNFAEIIESTHKKEQVEVANLLTGAIEKI